MRREGALLNVRKTGNELQEELDRKIDEEFGLLWV